MAQSFYGCMPGRSGQAMTGVSRYPLAFLASALLTFRFLPYHRHHKAIGRLPWLDRFFNPIGPLVKHPDRRKELAPAS